MSRFSFPNAGCARHGVFKTSSVRITVLTPFLLRLETGVFTDLPTQTVWNREFPAVSCTHSQKNKYFYIETDSVSFCIDVKSGKMVSITLNQGKPITDFQKGNLLGTARTLDNVNGATSLAPGLMSRSGVAVLDDSQSLLLDRDGKLLPREKCTDLYFFAYGSDYLRCLRDFYRLTGPVPLIPKYALGNWWSRYRAYTQEEYRKLMERFIEEEIPITVATIDMDWHWTDVADRFGKEAANPGAPRTPQEAFYNLNMPGWTGYSWNTELFPDHKAFLSWLHSQGFRVTMNVHPSQGIRSFEDCYGAMCQRLGLDAAKGERIPFDIADEAFVEAYLDEAHHPQEAAGVDFWWLDWQQGSVTDIPGLDPLWALNHYHTLDNGRTGKRPLILSRYAGPGSHRYPLGFSGDTVISWKSLQFQPYFTNTAANIGYTWWSHDIGGHMRGIQDDELYLRWLQYGVFSPINRLHSSNSEFMGKEPWNRSWAVEKIAGNFLRLRHKLIPYLYTANYRAHSESIPLCMPLYYVHDCKEAYEEKNGYYFGSQLLVYPITQPTDRRLNLATCRGWLPEGRWTDIFTGRIYRGGQWVSFHRDLDSIPVLAGEGTILPMYHHSKTNDLSLSQPLEIHIWRGNGSYELYEDDGITLECRDGRFAITQMELKENADQLEFLLHSAWGDTTLLPEKRKFILRFRDIQAADVAINDVYSGQLPPDGIRIYADPLEDTRISLTNFVAAVNPPKDVLYTALQTRIQAENGWKQRVFRPGKLSAPLERIPGNVSDALREIDALLYE